jgi:hypothetical protein
MPDAQLQARLVSEGIGIQLESYSDNLPHFHRTHTVADRTKPDGIELIWPDAHQQFQVCSVPDGTHAEDPAFSTEDGRLPLPTERL